MKNSRWIGFVAARNITKGRKNSPSPVFSMLGIATGVLALIVIIAVMNGFQLGFIENILEISSGHLRLEGYLNEESHDELTGRLRSLPGIVSVLPFSETNLLIRGRAGNPRGAFLKLVPPEALYLDPGMAEKLDIEAGDFDLHSPHSIILGAELARHLFVNVGDHVELFSMAGGLGDFFGDDSPVYTVSGIFRSGFYEYDLGWGFVSHEAEADLSQDPLLPVLGIKIRNRWQDQRVMDEVQKLLTEMNIPEGEGGLSLSSWREYNRAFFGALRTEKLIMFILVGLIFIVVGLNIYQAQRRIVLERREEIGLLRALGASDLSVRLVFVFDGLIIGAAGAGMGLALGLLIAFNIPVFFSTLESIVNFFVMALNEISRVMGVGGGTGDFSIFSRQIFYIKEIPSRVIFVEVLLIVVFGFLSALLAAWFASGKVSGSRPAEVLRYE